MDAKWIIKEDELLRCKNDGTLLVVPAAEIYQFSKKRPSELPHLSYERFPAKLAIRIMTGARGLPAISVIGVLHGEELPIANVRTRRSNHFTDRQRWFAVDDTELKNIRDALAAIDLETCDSLSLGQYLNLLRVAQDTEISLIDEWIGNARSAADAESAAIEGLPEINGNLYPYQVQGFRWLLSITQEGLGCILGDEMGLGKTLQVITLLASEKDSARQTSLIICPATILENWRREIAKFAPQLSVLLHQGSTRTGSPELFTMADIVLTSYDTAVRDQLLLSELTWNIVVLDEAQAIRNPDAQRTAATKSIPKRASIAVTGTPVENRLEDLWSIVDFVLPQMLGTREEFLTNFEDTVSDAHRLGPIVSPVLLRRRVSEVAGDLPARIDIPQPLHLTPKLAASYEQVRQEAEIQYGAGAGLVSLTRLRMFCSHPLLLSDWSAGLAESWPKYERLIEILEEIVCANQKALVFSGYNGIADYLINALPVRFSGLYVDCIDGRVSIKHRQPLLDKFTQASGPGVLVLNPKAAGTGLNITAANHVIHYSPEWNPAVEDQASARAYRRGQSLPVTVHRLFYLATVEEVMIERLDHKRNLAAGAVTGTEGSTDASDMIRALRASPLSNM